MVSLRTIRRTAITFLLRHFKTTLAVSVALVLLMGYFFTIEAKLRDVREVGLQSLSAKETELADRQQLLDRLRQARETFRRLSSAEIERIVQILPNQKDVPGIFLQIESLAKDAGVTLSNIEVTEQGAITTPVSSSAKGQSIQRLSVAIQVDGLENYEKFKAFLDLIERNMRLFDLSALTYRPGTTGYGLNLTTYYLAK